MFSNKPGSFPERNNQFVHRNALSVERFAILGGIFILSYRLFFDLTLFFRCRQRGPGSHRNTPPKERRTRTKPDHEQTLETGDAKDPGGDEGKGNAASAKPHSREAEQGHTCERGTSRSADQKEHG